MSLIDTPKTVLVLVQTTPQQQFELNLPAIDVIGLELTNVTMTGVTSSGTSLVASILELGSHHNVSAIHKTSAVGVNIPIAWVQAAGPPIQSLQLNPIYIQLLHPTNIQQVTINIGSENGNGTSGATFGVGWKAIWRLVLSHQTRL